MEIFLQYILPCIVALTPAMILGISYFFAIKKCKDETALACFIGVIGFLPVGILLTYSSNSLDGMRHIMPFGILSIIASLICLIIYILRKIIIIREIIIRKIIKNNYLKNKSKQKITIKDEYYKKISDTIGTNLNKQYIPITDFMEKDIVDMVRIIIKDMEEDNYVNLKINTMPYITDIITKGKDVCQKAFLKMIEENEKKQFDGFAIVCLKLMFFIGMGAVYLYKEDESFDVNKIFETISKKRGFLYIDEYVLDSFNIPPNSPEELTFDNDLYYYSTNILDLYMVETENMKEDVSNLVKCMLAMYTVGVSYATEILK